MNRSTLTILGVLVASGIAVAPSRATDTDGPDCNQLRKDYGDAPECVPAYPTGVLGQFPTCSGDCGAGTQEVDGICPPRSKPPLHTGYVRHVHLPQLGPPIWLGCYPGGGGIDDDLDGKVNIPPIGASACAPGVTTDCVTTAFGLSFDQDECFGDGSDAGITTMPSLVACQTASVTFEATSCATADREFFLNILIDYNQDGDWNDNFLCPIDLCAYEWAVKNQSVILPAGCSTQVSPSFLVGPNPGPSWMRIEIAFNPVPDDFPWNGSLGVPTQILQGGETEDYPVTIAVSPVGVDPKARSGEGVSLRSENPVRTGEARIAFQLQRTEHAEVVVFDVAGQRVRTVAAGTFAGGVEHTVRWDGTDDRGQRVARGIYFYRVRSASFAGEKKLVMLER